jgi:hypothetical protein
MEVADARKLKPLEEREPDGPRQRELGMHPTAKKKAELPW